MQVSVVLQAKGSDVVTADPATSLTEVVSVLNSRRIGAVVVSADGKHIDGVLTERDIVRVLADEGPSALDRTAAEVMTSDVFTCAPNTTIEELMATMTDRRVRHIPVLVDGELAGVVSIGDVVKNRISSLEHETEALHSYISNPY